jgi:curved DNA-binding protein CbpA
MAQPTITEDYYSTLEVDQTATPELITRAYRRLALKLHPDRGGSTHAFQLLGLAYETLNDETKRRAYDQVYPSIIRRGRTNPQSSNPAKESETRREDDLLATLRKKNELRDAQWKVQLESLMPPIVALQRTIRVLEQELKDLRDAAVAEAIAVRVRKNNPTAFYPVEDEEDEKARKDRRRQERRERRNAIESKEWQIDLREAELWAKKKVLKRAKRATYAANLVNDRRIQTIEARKLDSKAREHRERERERREGEKVQKLMRQANEAHATARKRQTEMQKSRREMRDQRAEAQRVEEEAQRATRDAAQRVRDDTEEMTPKGQETEMTLRK